MSLNLNPRRGKRRILRKERREEKFWELNKRVDQIRRVGTEVCGKRGNFKVGRREILFSHAALLIHPHGKTDLFSRVVHLRGPHGKIDFPVRFTTWHQSPYFSMRLHLPTSMEPK